MILQSLLIENKCSKTRQYVKYEDYEISVTITSQIQLRRTTYQLTYVTIICIFTLIRSYVYQGNNSTQMVRNS